MSFSRRSLTFPDVGCPPPKATRSSCASGISRCHRGGGPRIEPGPFLAVGPWRFSRRPPATPCGHARAEAAACSQYANQVSAQRAQDTRDADGDASIASRCRAGARPATAAARHDRRRRRLPAIRRRPAAFVHGASSRSASPRRSTCPSAPVQSGVKHDGGLPLKAWSGDRTSLPPDAPYMKVSRPLLRRRLRCCRYRRRCRRCHRYRRPAGCRRCCQPRPRARSRSPSRAC